ncbi:OLC1v1029464C1 [Oldenlandia corymbosa var. corymbosa]|nr:OLC1v1029464C1 [Oldenlandia corymbosa var. corymbosa]
MVKQSAALNRLGAESMKPRQLSDAIHKEIGSKVMNQISDGIWTVLRSGDQMTGEITETVQTVYSKLLNPKMNEIGGSSSGSVLTPVHEGHHNQSVATSHNEIHVNQFEGETNEPPGFSRNDRNYSNENNSVDHIEERERMARPCNGEVPVEREKTTSSTDALESSQALPHVPEAVEAMESEDNDDDDPDVPPGFG